MLLKQRESGLLVLLDDISDLITPYESKVWGRLQYGEEQQDPDLFEKRDLCFLSGELLPRCWADPHYRDSELVRRCGTSAKDEPGTYYGA